MADENDWDGLDRRTGDPWRRHIHGRVDDIERRLGDGTNRMSELSTQVGLAQEGIRVVGQDLRHNNRLTEENNVKVTRVLERLDPITKIFTDEDEAKALVRSFRAARGTNDGARFLLTLLALIGAASGGVGILLWVITRLSHGV